MAFGATSVDRDGNYKVRGNKLEHARYRPRVGCCSIPGTDLVYGAKGNGEWRRLPNALGRLLVHALTSEAHDARRMLNETEQSVISGTAVAYGPTRSECDGPSLKSVLPQVRAPLSLRARSPCLVLTSDDNVQTAAVCTRGERHQ
eukprot:1063484-Rhodomonas_salina.2